MSESVTVARRLSEAELDDRLQAADEAPRIRRLGFIKNLYCGDSVREAIAREGFSSSTGYRWLKAWNTGGITAMMPDYAGGRPPKLSKEERERFRAIIEREQPCTTTEVVEILDTTFGVTYAPAYLPRVLDEIGIEYEPPDRETAPRKAIVEAIEWDEKESIPTTGRHPYDSPEHPSTAGWVLQE
ncbi:transposase [Haloplanus rallus]|uniref:Transposase n=1 Tax=Haloplanus rallus TaxID=1816183 RepID=A0A6B9FFX0_9EURY|nr:helix-turn-helix domain-containing protein [Haloplanus rallus]QGX94833.1 transposase [Haloplanus rallus]